ncbi:hypothetical protein AAVH_17827 [Aphelenchoides avenae]|nr:hypothetical protein AAVH_17827 [Aphelenchus avenae]
MIYVRYLVAFIVGFPLFLFHISVTLCILSRRLNRNPSFQSAFFLVYIHNSVVDLLCFVSTLLIYALHIERNTSLDITWQNGKILHCILPFALCFQFSGHVIIALNRYTIFTHPDKHIQIWSGRRLKVVFCLLYVLPSACAIFRFFGDVRVAVQDSGPVLVWSPVWIYMVAEFLTW